MKFFPAAAALIATLGLAPSTQAALVTKTIVFSLITPRFGAIDGNFTVLYSTAQSETDNTANVTLNSLTGFTLGSTFAFTYDRTTDAMSVGGLESGADTALSNTVDFSLAIANVTTSPVFFGGEVTNGEARDVAEGNSTISQTNVTIIDTPEPASLALLGVALAGLGGLRRRGR